MANILLLNGPNLNLLGTREPDIYGAATLSELEHRLRQEAAKLGHQLQCHQSNAEHALIEAVHQAPQDDIQFIIINPAALTHTSVALRDALLGVNIPFIEVHISNIFARDSFRQRSYLTDIAIGSICGLGIQGYDLALLAVDNYLKNSEN